MVMLEFLLPRTGWRGGQAARIDGVQFWRARLMRPEVRRSVFFGLAAAQSIRLSSRDRESPVVAPVVEQSAATFGPQRAFFQLTNSVSPMLYQPFRQGRKFWAPIVPLRPCHLIGLQPPRRPRLGCIRPAACVHADMADLRPQLLAAVPQPSARMADSALTVLLSPFCSTTSCVNNLAARFCVRL